MEAHPVPKNVLDVEFKLFGSLTVRQFTKILAGSLVALVLYLLPIPVLISLPLMVVAVLTGLGAALVPSFEVKVSAILKSVFVSPRYVWRKKKYIPDLLSDKAQTEAKRVTGVAGSGKGKSAGSSPSVTLDDLSIDQILEARSIYAKEAGLDAGGAEDPNFARVYEQQFASATSAPLPQQQPAKLQAPVQATPQVPAQVASPAPSQQKASAQASAQTEGPTNTEYKAEIEQLRAKLNELNKQEGKEAERRQVLERINELYSLIGITVNSPIKLPSAQGVIEPESENTRSIFGVVVDKSGNPVPQASIYLLDSQNQPLGINTQAAEDGRFSMQIDRSLTEIVVAIDKPGYRFLPFKVKLATGTLPAYKFRAH